MGIDPDANRYEHEHYIPEPRMSWGAIAVWGAAGGLLGGVAMMLLMMVAAAARGHSLFQPLYLIAATFHPSWASLSGVAALPILAGIVAYLVIAVILGAVFALVWRFIVPQPLTAAATVIAGMIWGVAVYIVMSFAVLPVVDEPLARAVLAPTLLVWWLLGHLIFGAITGLVAGLATGQYVSPLTRARNRATA